MDYMDTINQSLVKLFNVVLKQEEKALKESTFRNLSMSEIHTLEAISLSGQNTMSSVAKDLSITVSTLTTAIDKLVAKGYVDRFRINEDRRIVKVTLTEKGKQALKEHEAFHIAMVSEALAMLSLEEKKLFSDTLESLLSFFLFKELKDTNEVYEVKYGPLYIKDLKVPKPVFQGGMGVGYSLKNLAVSVSKEGGAGTISSMEIGFRESDYETNPLEANLRALEREIKEALREVKDVNDRGPVGVNIISTVKEYEAYVRAAVSAGAEFIVVSGGLPVSLPKIAKDSHIKLIPLVSSLRAMQLILKYWEKKHNRLPDAFIYEGPFQGGHLGIPKERLPREVFMFYKTISAMRNELNKYPDIKLIVSGGIMNKEEMDKVMALGAHFIQMGTRFVATKECDINDKIKKAYEACEDKDIKVIDTPLGMPARVLNNKFIEVLSENKKEAFTCNHCLSNCLGEESFYCIKDKLLLAAKGDTDNSLIYIGAKGGKIGETKSVSIIFKELFSS